MDELRARVGILRERLAELEQSAIRRNNRMLEPLVPSQTSKLDSYVGPPRTGVVRSPSAGNLAHAAAGMSPHPTRLSLGALPEGVAPCATGGIVGALGSADTASPVILTREVAERPSALTPIARHGPPLIARLGREAGRRKSVGPATSNPNEAPAAQALAARPGRLLVPHLAQRSPKETKLHVCWVDDFPGIRLPSATSERRPAPAPDAATGCHSGIRHRVHVAGALHPGVSCRPACAPWTTAAAGGGRAVSTSRGVRFC